MTVDAIRWGVLLPTFDPLRAGMQSVVAAGRQAEALGFDAVWAGDHLICPAPGLDALCCLAATAAVTERVGLGISVLQLGLRHLVWTAKQLVTIDALAPGRLQLGVGVGGEFESEFTAAGVDTRSRGRRLDEMLDVLPALLHGRPVDHRGPHVEAHVTGLEPAISRQPPIVVGGRSEAALVRAARYGDQWMAMWHDPDTIRSSRARLAELAAAQGRPAPSVSLLMLVNVDDDTSEAVRQAAAVLDGQYGLPLRVVARWTACGPPDPVAKMLLEYCDAGVEEFVLLPADGNYPEQYERLAEVCRVVDQSRS